MAGYVAAAASRSVVEAVTAPLDKAQNSVATERTLVKVGYLVARLIAEVAVVALHEFDTFLVAPAATTEVRGMLLHIRGHVLNVEVRPAT